MPETLELVLHRGAVVTGTVTAIRGRRFVSGATVTIVSAGMRRVARTDEQGAFQLSDVDPGPTRVIVSHPAYATRELDIDVQSPGPLSRAQELDPIDLDDPGEIEGEVVDANGEPVSGARLGIGVVPAYAPAGASLDTMTVTDTRGRFRLTGVNPGTIELQAYAPEVGRGSTTVGVEPGRPTADVRIQLTAEASEADATAACSVAVTLGERGTDPVEVVIVDVSELSEAERAGLRPGDVLVAVDGVEPVDMHDARARLSGPESSDVVIEVRRDDGTHRFTTARERVRQ